MPIEGHIMATMWLYTWTEFERGWGQRPDGCSIHATREDALQFIKDYRVRARKIDGGVVPDEYSREDSKEPTEIVIDGRNKFYKQVVAAKKKGENGIRLWQSQYHELRKKMDTRPRVGR
jgi:hypothetical protein